MSDEWPKTWKEIQKDNNNVVEVPDDHNYMNITDTWTKLVTGVRGYNGTLYVNESAGRETNESTDQWMPLEVYLERKS